MIKNIMDSYNKLNIDDEEIDKEDYNNNKNKNEENKNLVKRGKKDNNEIKKFNRDDVNMKNSEYEREDN